nr:MAG TPA: Int protein/DNA Complex protein - DNA complex.79A [Caudoviricetes sp.]
MAKKAKMDQYALKKILGHYIDDVTEKYYIKPGMDWLRNEIEKIK